MLGDPVVFGSNTGGRIAARGPPCDGDTGKQEECCIILDEGSGDLVAFI